MNKLPKHLYYSHDAEDKVETLFVLESPYYEELYWGYPCMGATGMKMSEILIGNKDIALGTLIQHDYAQTRNYALFETFKFPLDSKLTEGLDGDEMIWKGIKKEKTKRQIENFFEQYKDYFPNSYKFNLGSGIRLFSKLKRIVVCGDIAQVVFEKIFSDKLVQSDQTVGNRGKTLDVVYAKHPAYAAYRHRMWTYQPNNTPVYKLIC